MRYFLTVWALAVGLTGCGRPDDDAFSGPLGQPAWMEELQTLSTYCEDLRDRTHRLSDKALTDVEQRFLGVWRFDEEVQNGGLIQYYYNASGEHAAILPDWLRTIGADDLGKKMDEANALLGSEGPYTDLAARREQLQALSEDARERLIELEDPLKDHSRHLLRLLQQHLKEVRPTLFNPDTGP